MSAKRVTIALNTKQSQKAPLLIPASAPTRALVFKTAQSKLRLKKPLRIFVGGSGQELLNDDDWELHVKNDAVLLISAGEDFFGVKKESSIHANPNCAIELLAANTLVETLAVTQLTTTAHTLPGIIHAVGQPDLHPGTQYPVGAVFASRRWIHPPLIGGDIGCGMAWYKTTLSRSQVQGDKGRKVAEKLRGLEGPWRTQAHRETWLKDNEGNCSAGEEWDTSLGTIGAGNHFAEIQVVEESALKEGDDPALRQDDVVLLVHSGSRGYGGSILKKSTAASRTSLEEDTPDAIDYIKEHDKACEWAKANRDLIALRFLSCLEPGNEAWELGDAHAGEGEINDAAVALARKRVQERKMVDIWHNNVERVKWPPSPPSMSDATSKLSPGEGESPHEYVWIHRKGAAPTYDPNTQKPLSLLPLPGSRGTPTLILVPTFSTSTSYGLKNALSLAHGAGRAMTRTKALSSLASKYKGQNILEPKAGDADGTWVICEEKDLIWEEAPEAYKDVEAVGQDLVDAGVAEIVGRCRARVSYKVRNEAR